MAGLFDMFDKADALQWRAGIERELKGKDYNSLVQSIAQQQLEPFYADRPEGMDLLPSGESSNDWLIGAPFGADNSELNDTILQSLVQGAESIKIIFKAGQNIDFNTVLDQVQSDWIEVNLVFDNAEEARKGMELFYHFLESRTIDFAQQRGSVAFNNQGNEADWILFVDQWRSKLPLWRYFVVPIAVDETMDQDFIAELTETARQTEKFITALVKRNVPLETISGLISYDVTLISHFLVNIATIRALRLLIGNVWQKFGYPIYADDVKINANSTVFASDRKQDFHRIEMANQAMSAVMGGVQTLNVYPAIELESRSDFDRRIAINLQHILKYEAFFDRVQDPLAGSYSIEQMTWSIASQAFEGI